MPNLIGHTLGGYRIIEQIGLGGMATVFKAYQPAMDRYIALKIISTHLVQDPSFLRRFEQEAKVIAKLEHVSILPVYDYGQEEGYFYLAMRLVEAGTLTNRLKAGPLSLNEVRRVVAQVGSALAYAHQLGVIHRDFKPSNVLMDAQGDCYLTDFGIAKMVEDTMGLTGSGVLGTPYYMAPEQGRSQQVDHRTDLYAMGVAIYEMVTGRVPFDAETPFAVVFKHISEPLPLPRSINPDLPEPVERVILKALAKNPTDRYQSMSELVAAFERALEGLPVEVLNATLPPLPAAPTVTAKGHPLSVDVSSPAARRWSPWWLVAGASMLFVLVLAGGMFSRTEGGINFWGGPESPDENTFATQVAATLYAGQTAQAQAFTATPTATFTPTPTSTPLPPTSTPTQTPTPLPDAIVSAELIKVWAGPGSHYEIVGQAASGDILQVSGRNTTGDWLEVVTPDGTHGWVAAMWLQVNVALNDVAEATIPPTLVPTSTPRPTSTPTVAIPTPTRAPNYINPGQSIADAANDVSAPHADVVAFNSTLQGETLRVTLQLNDLPSELTINRAAKTKYGLEYQWNVAVDIDGSATRIYRDEIDYQFYFFYAGGQEPEKTYPTEMLIEQLVNENLIVVLEKNTGTGYLSCISVNNQAPPSMGTANGNMAGCNINILIDAQANTITFAGVLPGISAESRLFFETCDYFAGCDYVN